MGARSEGTHGDEMREYERYEQDGVPCDCWLCVRDLGGCQWRPLQNLWTCLETAGALTLQGSMAYTKGFDDGLMLHVFCEPGGMDYYPTPDSRPTAERLEWSGF